MVLMAAMLWFSRTEQTGVSAWSSCFRIVAFLIFRGVVVVMLALFFSGTHFQTVLCSICQ